MAAHAVLDAPVTSPVVFRVGDYFTFFSKLEEKIKSYEQSNFGREKPEMLLLPQRELTGT